MASLKTVLQLGVCLSAWIITTAGNFPQAENVHWVSLDFKTILKWTVTPSDHTFSVTLSGDGSDWIESPDCLQRSETECDVTNIVKAFNKGYIADIQTEPLDTDDDLIHEELPHTHSPPFNPYSESLISAVNITVERIDDSRVSVNIVDPLTSIHDNGRQLNIRDVLKKDLKYKIIYYKSGNTGQRHNISDTNMTVVSKLDAGYSYCFMVAAFIPSRPLATQLGTWSKQMCTPEERTALGLGAKIGIAVVLIAAIIAIITVTVCCSKHCNTSKSSGPV